VDARLRQRTIDEAIAHLSIFALASIPLLIHLGYEIGEAIPSEIYQGHRDTQSWAWQSPSGQDPRYIIDAPEDLNACDTKAVVLNLSLSGVIQPQEIDRVMTAPYSTYTVTIPKPHRDYLKSREQLKVFAAELRVLLRQIREVHGTDCEIHLFSAIPAAVALKLGQLLLPKVDPPIHIYDYHQLNGGFSYALTVPRREPA
jgi:hypothetical protein